MLPKNSKVVGSKVADTKAFNYVLFIYRRRKKKKETVKYLLDGFLRKMVKISKVLVCDRNGLIYSCTLEVMGRKFDCYNEAQ